MKVFLKVTWPSWLLSVFSLILFLFNLEALSLFFLGGSVGVGLYRIMEFYPILIGGKRRLSIPVFSLQGKELSEVPEDFLQPEEVQRREVEKKEERKKMILPLLTALRRSLGAHLVCYYLRGEGEKLYLQLADSYEEDLPLKRIVGEEDGLLFYAFREGKLVLAQEYKKPLSGMGHYTGGRAIYSFLAVPLFYKGQCFGVVAVDSYEVQAFSDEHKTVVDLIGKAIMNIEYLFLTYTEKNEEVIQWQGLFHIAYDLYQTKRFSETLTAFLRWVERVVPAQLVAFVEEISPDRFLIVGAIGEGADTLQNGLFSQENSWIGWALNQEGVREVRDLSTLPPGLHLFYPKDPYSRRGMVVAFPIGKDQEVHSSLLLLWSRFPHRFTSQEKDLLLKLLAPFHLAYGRAKAMEELRRLATTDTLTGLYNRRYAMGFLEREIQRSRRHKTPLAVILLDVDHFKKVNDRYGHDVGDLVLKRVAKILQRHTREVDITARLGGEEFLVLLPQTDRKGGRNLAERIRKSVKKEEILTPTQIVKVTVSCGVATFKEGDNTDTLLKRADQALYRAKEKGRDRVEEEIPSEKSLIEEIGEEIEENRKEKE